MDKLNLRLAAVDAPADIESPALADHMHAGRVLSKSTAPRRRSAEVLESRTGVEPVWTALQAAA